MRKLSRSEMSNVNAGLSYTAYCQYCGKPFGPYSYFTGLMLLVQYIKATNEKNEHERLVHEMGDLIY